jgi:hypothetical protein
VGDLLKKRGDPLAGLLGRLGQVPGIPFGLAGQPGRELRMRVAALLAGRQLHDRRADERVAEGQACGGLVGPHEPGPFGRFQALSCTVGGERPDQAQIARAVQDGQEQQVIDGGRQGLDAGGEGRPQPAAGRQRRGKGSGHGLSQVAEGDREFEQGKRVAQGGVQQPPPAGRSSPRPGHPTAAALPRLPG